MQKQELSSNLIPFKPRLRPSTLKQRRRDVHKRRPSRKLPRKTSIPKEQPNGQPMMRQPQPRTLAVPAMVHR